MRTILKFSLLPLCTAFSFLPATSAHAGLINVSDTFATAAPEVQGNISSLNYFWDNTPSAHQIPLNEQSLMIDTQRDNHLDFSVPFFTSNPFNVVSDAAAFSANFSFTLKSDFANPVGLNFNPDNYR